MDVVADLPADPQAAEPVQQGEGLLDHPAVHVWVPKTSSTSCDQAIFVDQPSDMSSFSDAVVAEVDRFG